MNGPSLITRVAIVGAGIPGLSMASSLLDAGITDFAITAQDNEVDGTHRLQRHLMASAQVRSARYQDHDGTWILTTRTGLGFWSENIVVAGYTTNPAAAPVDIRGREDAHLDQQGTSDAFLGLAVPGFPNLYLLGAHRFAPMLGSTAATAVQTRYIVDCLHEHYRLAAPLEVRTEAVRGYQQRLDTEPLRTVADFDRIARHFSPTTAFSAVPDPYQLSDFPWPPEVPAASTHRRVLQ